jgi:hypothetical protein
MKKQFFGYYRLSDEEFKILWNSCTFVIDASILCNLYRLPEEVRNEIIKVLFKVKDRLWMPHQAALEFQRNRPEIIHEQKKTFDQVRKVFNESKETFNKLDSLQLKKRHSLIKPDSFQKGFDGLIRSFEDELEEIQKKQADVNDYDIIREKIDKLLEGKIGSPPSDQKAVDEIYSEGEVRYQNKIPPGYIDKTNKKGGSYDYEYGGIKYKRLYGDLLIWKQILNEAKAKNLKHIILLTDDRKEDWWWIVGGKTLGPRPELYSEINRVAGVELLHIYTLERFLEFSITYLDVKVSETLINIAKDIVEFQYARQKRKKVIPKKKPYHIIESLMYDLAADLVDSDDEVTSTIAQTNAFGYGLDDYEILNASFNEDGGIEFEAEINLSGDTDSESPFCGDEITVHLKGVAEKSKNKWYVESYEILSCEVNF